MDKEIMKYLISRILENAEATVEKVKRNEADAFEQGKNLAYYEVLNTLSGELDAYGLSPAEYGIPDNLEKLL